MRYQRVEFDYNPIGGWRDGNPFTTMFAHAKNGENLMIVGGLNDCEDYLKTLVVPVFWTAAYWSGGFARQTIRFSNIPTDKNGKELYFVTARKVIINPEYTKFIKEHGEREYYNLFRNERPREYLAIKGMDLQIYDTTGERYKLIFEKVYSHIPSDYPRDIMEIF